MSSLQYLEVVFYFLLLTELMRFSTLSFVLWSFQVLGKDSMDYGIRSGKSLILGMPRKASPLSSSFIGNFTWSYIFIRHMIFVWLGASFYFVSIYLLFEYNTKIWNSLILESLHIVSQLFDYSLVFIYILWSSLSFALVIHLYLFRAWW